MPQPDTEQQPIFQHLLQLLAALFQSCRVCPHAWESGDFTVMQTVILKNFVDGLMHCRVYVLGKHGSVCGHSENYVGACIKRRCDKKRM